MNLFIANCSKQNLEFTYRLPGSMQVVRMPIEAGKQVNISNLKQPDLDAIIKQHAKYGLVHAKEAAGKQQFAGYAYSVDKPVTLNQITDKMEHNVDVAVDRANDMRAATTLATAEALQEDAAKIGVEVGDVSVEVREEMKNPSDSGEKFNQKFSSKEQRNRNR